MHNAVDTLSNASTQSISSRVINTQPEASNASPIGQTRQGQTVTVAPTPNHTLCGTGGLDRLLIGGMSVVTTALCTVEGYMISALAKGNLSTPVLAVFGTSSTLTGCGVGFTSAFVGVLVADKVRACLAPPHARPELRIEPEGASDDNLSLNSTEIFSEYTAFTEDGPSNEEVINAQPR